jgi:hypothetical protein
MKRPHWSRRFVLLVSLVFTLSLAAGVAWGGNYDTFYCGNPSTYCQLGSGGYASTASTALRDNNYVRCNVGCHVHVWYDNGNGAYDITHSNGAIDALITAGSIGYAYSRCETDSGYGWNWATCDTMWHT